jgi:spore coat protein U-like protein
MKSLKLAVVAISLIGVFGVGNAMAANPVDANLEVKANVDEACAFVGNAVVNFNTIDPLNPTPLSLTTTDISITCTNLTLYTVSDDGVRQMANGGATDTIDYELTYTDTAQTATGSAVPLSVKVDLPAANYAGVAAGSYTGTTTFTVSF